MKIKDIMRTDFVRINASESLEEVLKKFIKWNVTSAPVFEDQELVGIVTISNIVKFLNSKRNIFSIWRRGTKNEKSDLVFQAIATTQASKIATKPKLVLKPDDDLDSAAAKAANTCECIPVIEGQRVVGIIRSKDLVIYLLTEIAFHHSQTALKGLYEAVAINKGSAYQHLPQQDVATVQASITSTTADKIMELIKENDAMSSKEIAAKIGTSEAYVEKIAEILEKHKLLKIEYNLLNGMIVKRLDHEKA